jgi:hypothetical protein
MFRFPRRSAASARVQFCDGCAEVSTAADRAQRRVERIRAELTALAGPR